MAKQQLAFIGLGVMGHPMAGHLLASGCKLKVFNRTGEKAKSWLKQYGNEQNEAQVNVADTVAEACEGADFIFTCVGNDQDLEEIMLSDNGVFASAKSGAIVCDHTTSSARLARSLSLQALELGIGFLDAPVSGGQAGAENGVLSIMVGGEEAHYQSALPLIRCYGKTIDRIGDSGSGQLAKMVNQICITGILEALSEALYFGEAAGLDLEKVLAVISGGAAQSWQMENRASTMLEGKFDFGFAVDWMRKDLAFVLEEAENLGLELSLVDQIDHYYKEIQESGGGRWDTSSLYTRYQKNKK